MSITEILEVDQSDIKKVTDVISDEHPFTFRYAYSIKDERFENREKGQDYLAAKYNNKKFVFTCIDGVSNSYAPDLGSKLLGDFLLDRLFTYDFDSLETFSSEINSLLSEASAKFKQGIEAVPFPTNIPERVVAVLQKRRAKGSQAVFALGVLDFSTNHSYFVNLGDTSIILWSKKKQLILGGSTGQKLVNYWSSNGGLVGSFDTTMVQTKDIIKVAAFSDGLNNLLNIIDDWPNSECLENLIEQAFMSPSSDDISFIEVTIKGGNQKKKIFEILSNTKQKVRDFFIGIRKN